MNKRFLSFIGGACIAVSCIAGNDLRFDPLNYRLDSITMPAGVVVRFKAYEGLFYVRNIEDSVYQRLNIYVPVDLKGRANVDIPI